MIDGLLVVIRPYDRAPKKFDEVGEVKIVKKTAHRPSVSTKRPRSADGKSSRTARVLKSSSSEKEKKKLPLSSNAPSNARSVKIDSRRQADGARITGQGGDSSVTRAYGSI